MLIDDQKMKDIFERVHPDSAPLLEVRQILECDDPKRMLEGCLWAFFRSGFIEAQKLKEQSENKRSEYHRQYYLKRKNGQGKPKPKATPKKKPTAKKKTTLPDDAVLTDDNRRKALAYWGTRGCRRDADHEWQRFCALHWAKANMYVDWNQAWVTWYTNAVDYGKELKEMY